MATLHPGSPEGESSSLGSSTRKALSVMPGMSQAQGASNIQGQKGDNLQANLLNDCLTSSTDLQPNYVACVAAIICIVALFLPTEGDSSSSISQVH